MVAANVLAEDRDDSPQEDHIVVLDGVSWSDYERILEARGDRSAPRIAYSKGLLEIMSPSHTHESIKSLIGRLVETFCLETDVELTAVGSWTIKDKQAERGVEPDECYVFGPVAAATKPDLAIEVVWTSGGVRKLDIYRDLGVREVWIWRRGKLTVWLLGDHGYVEAPRSRGLPDIDLAELCSFLDRPTTTAAMRDYRNAIRAKRR